MRVAAIGDVHGRQHLADLQRDLERVGPVDFFLVAGDLTDRNDLDAYGKVLEAIRARIEAPVWAVFGNNEWSNDHETYVERFSGPYRIRFLQDEAATFEARGRRVRIVGSVGALDRPTWWQRRNAPHLEREYERRVGVIDRLLEADIPTILLTHYPPTYVTMGGEKESWRPELGCRALEPVLLRRKPAAVIHGHIHKGIAHAELAPDRGSLDTFLDALRPIPVHNVAYPARREVPILEV